MDTSLEIACNKLKMLIMTPFPLQLDFTVCQVSASGSDSSAVLVHHMYKLPPPPSFYLASLLLPLLHFIIFFFHTVSIFSIISSSAQPDSALHCKKIHRHAQPEVNAQHAHTQECIHCRSTMFSKSESKYIHTLRDGQCSI